jgi:glycosyltransferase involved in cell wall biosynthesis
MADRIKILHVIESITIGGAEKLLCNTIPEMPEYDHLVLSVFSSNDLSILPKDVKHVSLNAKTKMDVFLKRSAYKKIIKQYQPDLVHAHLYFATVLAKAFTPGKIPLIFTQHFEFSKNAPKWYYGSLDKFLSRKKHHCIAVSNRVLQDYLATTSFKGSVHVVGNYIPETYFKNSEKSDFGKKDLRLIAVGNVKPIKNQRYILEVFKNLKDLDVSCDIYGNGEEKELLESMAKKHDLKVHFKGIVTEPNSVLENYDLFIMPSLTEGFPLALFEAMAKKLPVLVSDIPVFHEMLNGSGNYMQLEKPGEVRDIILKYLNHPDLLKTDGQKMQTLARQKVDKKNYLDKLKNIYIQALNIKP